jgi:hypothetical protein
MKNDLIKRSNVRDVIQWTIQIKRSIIVNIENLKLAWQRLMLCVVTSVLETWCRST